MNKKNSMKGFTLIEIIVSLSILSIVIVSLLGMFSNGFISIINMGKKTKTVEQTKKIIDTIIYKESTEEDFLYNMKTDVAFKNTQITDLNSSLTDGSAISNIVIVISDLNAPSFNTVNNSLYKVTITVQYDNGTKTITLTSLIPQGGNLQ